MTARTFFYFKFFLLMFTALSILLLPTNSYAGPVAAIIYPNNAKITEHLAADLQTDNDRFFAQFFLPIHAAKDSLTVNTAPDSKMRITSVEFEKQMLPVADTVKKLKDKLKELNRQKSDDETRIKANTTYISFWQNQAANQPEKIENIESVQKLGDAIKKGITTAYSEIYRFNKSLEKTDKQIKEVQKQLNKLTGSAQKQWQVAVYLSGNPPENQSHKINLDYSYNIKNCNWRPIYTLNAHPDKSEIKLYWYAKITQNTGIDWDNVELKIATSQRFTRPDPPFLGDWVIQPRKIIATSSMRRKAMMAEESLMFADTAQTMGAGGPEPKRDVGVMFDTYDLGKHTISAGDTRRIKIREMDLKSDFKYLIRPQKAPQAFLFAQLNIKDDAFIRLPLGDASFLIDSAFITNRPFSMTDKEQKLFFGSDPQVDVTLDVREKKSGETGLLIGKKQYRWSWKVSIKNLKSHEVLVLMEDAYPQIRDERIKLEETFSGMSPQKEKNMVTWTFPVLPQTETAIKYGYQITYPDEMDISFGGR